jgi:hypothetical protein
MADTPRSELERKGYTNDEVIVSCAMCHKKVTCHYTRNPNPGPRHGQPLIELPEDWKVIYTMGDKEQATLCDTCDPNELDRRREVFL